MEISRNVILDLLPLYIADEASPETSALVEEYLETDPELAKIADKLSGAGCRNKFGNQEHTEILTDSARN